VNKAEYGAAWVAGEFGDFLRCVAFDIGQQQGLALHGAERGQGLL